MKKGNRSKANSKFLENIFEAEGRINKRQSLLVMAALSVLLLVTFGPVIFGGRTLLTSAFCPGTMPTGPYHYPGPPPPLPVIDPGASAWQNEPWAAEIRKEYGRGNWPLWNPHSGVGTPFLANIQSAPFSFFRIPLYLSSSPVAWDMYFLLRLLAAGLFTYLFLRLWKKSVVASLAGAIIFMFSGYNILYINMGHLDVDVLVPLVLFSFELLFRSWRPRHVALAGMAVCLCVWGGMPESAFFVLFFALLYYFFRTISTGLPARAGGAHYLGHIGRFFLPVILGFMLSGPQLFPFLQYLRSSWTGHPGSTGLTSNPLSGAISLVVPYFFGRIHHNWNQMSSHAFVPYLGGIPLLLAFLACLARKPKEGNKITYFFAGFSLFFLAKCYGLVFINWIGRLPLLQKMIFQKYCVPEFSFCIAALAALAIDRLARREIPPQRLVFSLCICLGLPFVYLGLKPAEFFPQLRDAQVLKYVLGQTAITAAGLLAVFLLSLWALRPAAKKIAVVAIVCAAFLELWWYIPRDRARRYDSATKPPFLSFLSRDRNKFRVLPLNSVLYPNSNCFYNLDAITVLDAMYPLRYWNYVRTCLSSHINDRFLGEELNGDLSPRLKYLSLMNVKYILAPNRLDHTLQDILDRSAVIPQNRWGIGLTSYTIGGQTKSVLSQHPPSRIMYPLFFESGTTLSFSIALSPGCWSPEKGDGVGFKLSVQQGGSTAEVFRKNIDPKNNPLQRRWFDYTVDLSAYKNKKINLIFETDPLKGNAYDWAGWGDIQLRSQNETKGLTLVYDKEIKIYKNNQALPRAYIVPHSIYVNDEKKALALLATADIPYDQYAIVEGSPPGPQGGETSVDKADFQSQVQIVDYQSQEIVIHAQNSRAGVLVLADLNDPGWKASVDGREQPILKANYLFRGLPLEPGNHLITFWYDSPAFKLGGLAFLISLAGLAGLGLLSRVKRKRAQRQ
jgi:hypothetical protein